MLAREEIAGTLAWEKTICGKAGREKRARKRERTVVGAGEYGKKLDAREERLRTIGNSESVSLGCGKWGKHVEYWTKRWEVNSSSEKIREKNVGQLLATTFAMQMKYR